MPTVCPVNTPTVSPRPLPPPTAPPPIVAGPVAFLVVLLWPKTAGGPEGPPPPGGQERRKKPSCKERYPNLMACADLPAHYFYAGIPDRACRTCNPQVRGSVQSDNGRESTGTFDCPGALITGQRAAWHYSCLDRSGVARVSIIQCKCCQQQSPYNDAYLATYYKCAPNRDVWDDDLEELE